MDDTNTKPSSADKPASEYAFSRKRIGGRPSDPRRKQRAILRPGTSKRSARACRIRLRQQKVLGLRLKGLGYAAIAKETGTTKSTAERDLINALDATIREDARSVFAMEMLRLDQLAAAHIDSALEGNVDSTYAVLAVMRHRALLLNWVGARAEPASARMMLTDGNGARELEISFVMPSGNKVGVDGLAPLPSPSPSHGNQHGNDNHDNHGAYQHDKPSPPPKRITPREDDITIERVIPDTLRKRHGGFAWE